MSSLFDPLEMRRGPALKNRFALAPLTNLQSQEDGIMSEEEFHWLTMRAKGGYALTMTCASHVHALGKGFSGQLGCFDETHLEGLTRLAAEIRKHESVSVVQLHHAGMRSPVDLIGQAPLCPSDDAKTGARAMSVDEVRQAVEAFVDAAERAAKAGFDGVEVHGAHGYLICQFLSPEINQREDLYGGSAENRARFLMEVIEGIRQRCRADFQVGVRLSPERFGLRLQEILDLSQKLFDGGQIDYLDASLWDVRKEPAEESFQGRSLLSYFCELKRGETRLSAAGKISSAEDARWSLGQGLDFVTQGRSAILHHDFPRRCQDNPDFKPAPLPVSPAHLASEGVSPTFVKYLGRFDGVVSPASS